MKNKEVLKYLENNPNIEQQSGFYLVKNLKYKEILQRYFLSSEFEDSINQLKKEKNYIAYYERYILNKENYDIGKEKNCFYNNDDNDEYDDDDNDNDNDNENLRAIKFNF